MENRIVLSKNTYVECLPHVLVAVVLVLMFARHDKVDIDVEIRLIVFALHCSAIVQVNAEAFKV